MSLERKKDKNKDKKIVKGEGEPSPHRVLSPTRSSNKEQVHFYQYLGAQLYYWLFLYVQQFAVAALLIDKFVLVRKFNVLKLFYVKFKDKISDAKRITGAAKDIPVPGG